jgi:hypothetical protein
MAHAQRKRIAVLACTLPAFMLLSFPTPAKSQTHEPSASEAPPACTVVDLDITVRFGNEETKAVSTQKEPSSVQVVTVQKRNISGHLCTFEQPINGPNFTPDRAEGEEPFTVNQIPFSPLKLEPGQAARQTWRWRSNMPDVGRSCFEPKWMWGPPLVVAPSLLKPVCSNIDLSPWSVVDAPHSPGESDASSSDAEVFAFKLTADKHVYDIGEWFPLHLSLDQASGSPAPREDCPTLYLRERSPDGATRIDEMKPLAFKGCKSHGFGMEIRGDWQSGFVLDSGANSRWAGHGTHTLQVFVLTGSPDDGLIQFASSNPLQLEVVDPATLLRQWGPLVKGLQADITLDKTEFSVGEEVPLHAAIENLSSDAPVFSWDTVWDPCEVAGIKIRDARGNPLPPSAFFEQTSICTGHGLGPRPLEKGKMVPLEWRLGALGALPKLPGDYIVDLIWTPCVGTATTSPSTGMIDPPKTCVTVTAEAAFRIVDRKHAE